MSLGLKLWTGKGGRFSTGIISRWYGVNLMTDELGSTITDTNSAFIKRHLGASERERQAMLESLGYSTIKDFIKDVLPPELNTRQIQIMSLPRPLGEPKLLRLAQEYAQLNRASKCFFGQGYYNSIIPPVIQRNVLENPLWYTPYTPYQAEISQGRLEALFNYQTLVTELTGLPIATASVLDECGAAAEAMTMLFRRYGNKEQANVFLVARGVFPQTIAYLNTRARPLGIIITLFDADEEGNLHLDSSQVFGALIQQPDNWGRIRDWTFTIALLKNQWKVNTAMAIDPMALMILKSPRQMGAEVALGSMQRYGLPLAYGGPHAAFLACSDTLKRHIPGRLVGISQDELGEPALRLALQTREQHIRRHQATSNICTAQALLAALAQFYALYHGPLGLKTIAQQINQKALNLARQAWRLGYRLPNWPFFDTVTILLSNEAEADQLIQIATKHNYLLRRIDSQTISCTMDETVDEQDLSMLISFLHQSSSKQVDVPVPSDAPSLEINESLKRSDNFLRQPVFNSYHTETELLRYINDLASRDLSLAHSMIPLGSCTMKLNPATSLLPLSWPSWTSIHPYAPKEDARGYQMVSKELERMLCEITGFTAFTFMPPSGAQGELTGLLMVRKYYESRGEARRNICLIPVSAHGTNPASATMAGLQTIGIACDKKGNIDRIDLKNKLAEYGSRVAVMMITYPSTFGVFDEGIGEVCQMVHEIGALVYWDGANMNALLGILKPADLGVDIGHLNMHKTFGIPHGGGGPGMGPVGVSPRLQPFLPRSYNQSPQRMDNIGPTAAAPFGSASLTIIPWSFIRMLGPEGLRACGEQAVLNANYLRRHLRGHYPLLYGNRHELCSHEFIIDCRLFKETVNIDVQDIAKRLQDYSIHSPTMSWPVPGTLLVEPTECESQTELDRFITALLGIRQEIAHIESGKWSMENNPLKRAPHPITVISKDYWDRPYSREEAAFPLPNLRYRKVWPTVARLNDVHGDQNFCCTRQLNPNSI